MSVTLASVYITVHLFGIPTSEKVNQSFGTWGKCVSWLESQAKRAKTDSNNNVTLLSKNGYLAISNQTTYKVEKHMCVEDNK